MDKAILKKFAIESRQDLMQKIESKIKLFYVDETFSKQQNGDVYVLSNEKHTLSLSKEEYDKRELLIKRIQELGLEQVIEEAAYTWFNRVVAIRYMEINDYLPLTKDNQSLGIRVLSSKDNTPDPEIMKFTNLVNPDLDIDFKKEKYAELKDDNDKFKYVLLLVCKKLGKVIPQVFDGITDYIDILIPDNLLNDTGFITKIVTEVPENNYNQVEIIGWLYQYYNQAEKDRVISAKKAYKKNEIPYATQLFTPDWIVKYMVENSLGRFWIEHSDNDSIIDNWKYFIKDNIEKQKEKTNPIEITLIDPCCGSGHILVYAFEILYQIYKSVGYNKNDIPELILKNNLYGLDIDDRAGQLSVLSVLLKAREYDRNIFNKVIAKNLNILSIQESNNNDSIMLDELSNNNQDNALYLLKSFINAKEIGSLLRIEKKDYSILEDEIEKNNTIFGITLQNKLLPLIKIAKILSNKYDIVVTNPPYMGERYMSDVVKKYLRQYYFVGRTDLFSTFILASKYMCKDNGAIGLISPYAWMFLDSYKDLRKFIIDNLNITSLIQLEFNAFEVAALPVCTYCFKNSTNNSNGSYIKLSDFTGAENQPIKALEAINNHNVYYFYQCKMEDFKVIDGTPIAFWLSNNMRNVFKNAKKINDYGITKQGMTTADNKRFLRFWFETNINNIKFDSKTLEEASESCKKWFPYNKGGRFRKWYGNNEYVVNYQYDGKEVKEYTATLPQGTGVRIKSREYYFKEAITWTFISIDIGVRYSTNGFIFDVAGSSLFVDKENILYVLGFMCTKLMKIFNQILNPTMNVQTSNVAQLPLIISNEYKSEINNIVKENISLSKEDWDNFETSWDFKTHPLLLFSNISPTQISKEEKNGFNCAEKIQDSFKKWSDYSNDRFEKQKQNENRLNEIFINIYDLANEIDSKIEDKDITIRKADKVREIKSLISYAVGCMFGRYSLDEDGLIYAGGEFNIDKYQLYSPDIDNIIPITEEAFFGDDIVSRFKDFLSKAFGSNSVTENMDYIAENLGKKGTETSEETIRRYFNNDFYADHIKMYQKKPIYWLFDSGKKNGFKALVYMHRYNENTIPKVRLDYLHRIQTTYEKLLTDINYKLTTELSMNEKKEVQKRQTDLNAKLQEIKEYDEKIAHIANQRISIDLDDGVTVNYDKFKDILAKIK